jgi:hypothetical protein
MLLVALVAVALGFGLARRRWAAYRVLAAREEALEAADAKSVEKLRSTIEQFAARAREHAAQAGTNDEEERRYRLSKVKELTEFISWSARRMSEARESEAAHAEAKRSLLSRW